AATAWRASAVLVPAGNSNTSEESKGFLKRTGLLTGSLAGAVDVGSSGGNVVGSRAAINGDAGPGPELVTDLGVDSSSEFDAGLGVDLSPALDGGLGADLSPEFDAGLGADLSPEFNAEPGAAAGAEFNADPGADFDVGPDPEPDPDSEPDTNPGLDVDAASDPCHRAAGGVEVSVTAASRDVCIRC